jgi:hypothetical protein
MTLRHFDNSSGGKSNLNGLKVKNRLRSGKVKTFAVEKSVSAERETVLIKTLPGYLGQEQHGPANLTE